MILLRFSVPVIIAACSVGAAQSNPLDPSNPLLSGWWSSDIGVYEDAAGTDLAEVGDLVQAWVDRSPNAWVLQPAAGPTRFVADSSHGLTIPALDSVTTAARLQLQDPGPAFGDPFDVAKGGELRVFFVTRTLDTFVGARILRKGNKFSGDIGWNIFHNDGAMYPRCNVNGIKAGQTKQTWPNQGDYQILTLELNDGFLFGYHNGSNVGFTHGQPGLPTVPHQPANAYQVYTRAGQVSGSSATTSRDTPGCNTRSRMVPMSPSISSRLRTSIWNERRRLKARSCPVRRSARRAAVWISWNSRACGSDGSRPTLPSSEEPMIVVKTLLNSCATLPASRPTASSFWVWLDRSAKCCSRSSMALRSRRVARNRPAHTTTKTLPQRKIWEIIVSISKLGTSPLTRKARNRV